ncbi:hypothetical protein [Paraglaciecola sp. 20A4]|uniref:hypothetical protein n=1 Tax=Paraglaciecola sp. 20A4 TaxID=2687288 RepID=UPI00140B495D|nr:hypothetical protein [Paraglaciecola sp. 20A4]
MFLLGDSRILVTLLVTAFTAIHLCYQYLTTGIEAHHFFADPDLPAISNLWGLLILPVLAWLTGTLIRKKQGNVFPLKIWLQIALTGLYAATMAWLFFSGFESVVSTIALPIILCVALFYPIYQPQYLLAYVVVSSIGFGAALPMIFGSIFAFLAFLTHQFIRPIYLWAFRKVKRSYTISSK